MPDDIATIERDALEALLDQGRPPLLVEVLAEPQYRAGHLPGAVNLPLGQLRERAPELLPDKEAEIVVYCASPT